MAQEVGRIKAVVTGDTTDFDKKMSGAQRTFEVTAQKLDATAQRTADSLKKTYSERAIAANAAAQKEIEAARRSLQERLRMTTSSAEIAAVRNQFTQRANAAREGARREIQAAQQQYLAASEGLRPIIASTQQMTTTAALTTSQFSKLRTATVAVANAAAGANPIFAQTSAVIGAMAGTGGVLALAVAGIAALGLAYNRATKDARELKEEQERLNKQLERAGRERAGLVAGAENITRDAAVKRMSEITALLAQLRTPQFRDVTDAKSGMVIARERLNVEGQILKLSQEYAALANRALGVDGKRADEAAKVSEEAMRAAEAFEQLLQSGKDINRELSESLAKLIEIADEAALAFRQRDALRNLAPGSGVITRPSSVTGMPRSVTRISTPTPAVPGESVNTRLKNFLKGQLDPQQIISSIASGGITALVGAAADFAGGLLTHAKRAKEALRLHMEAVNDWDRSIRASFAALRGETEKARRFEALDELTGRIKNLGETFKSNFGVIPVFDTMEDLIAWLKRQREIIALVNKLPGVDMTELDKRLEELIRYAEELGIQLGKTADAASKVSESLTNVPTGFKIALARFNATVPSMTVGSTPGRPTWDPTSRASVVNIANVEVYGVEDVPSLLEKIELEVTRKQLRGGTGISMGYL